MALIWTIGVGGTPIGDTITSTFTAPPTTFTDEQATTTTTTTGTITREPTHETPETSADPTSPVTVTVFSALPTETNTSRGGDGLSSGAKAGIGVGVALGFILIAAVGAIFWFRRRKRRGEDALREPPVITQNASVRMPPFEMD
ncbi:hypothetical protein BJY01DRAFT_241924 [Aspergillus pseudoustus]|uniref:Mid2 domain-containing protein n=1 Tax=Aspergillus pseudoustus TaxID=1810923 RepID=A0ABR4L225_9EURO